MGLVPPPPGLSDMRYVEGTAGQKVEMVYAAGAQAGADSAPAARPTPPPANDADDFGLTISGMPLIKPPYATISAINLDKGDIVWQVPAGESPNFIRNNPALKGLNIPRTGQQSYNIGTLVTKHLVIAGDAQVTITPDHPRGAMLRAYDQATGKDVGDVLMPAGQSGSPMTYMVNGKQYIIVAVSGGNYSGEYICYTLPDNG
jgi:quinoprotein glucose dehydrogenase